MKENEKRYRNHADMTNLAIRASDGHMQDLSNLIYTTLENVSDDLLPIGDYITSEQMSPVVTDEFIIEPQDALRRLHKVSVNKAPGPEGIPN